ncbi:MAG: iron ABC transporter permease [Ectothiorhodospiraceae bacterium]|nr:iron ABC transporter permease [Ectothiorhodospiraceae bacterium]
MQSLRVLFVLVVVGLSSLLLAVVVGSAAIPLGALWDVLSGEASEFQRLVLLDLRLPRALAAFGTGALLAISGALLQVLLRNPLADPYVLGVSGGAAVGALLVIMLGLSSALVPPAAFGGALGSTLLVFGLAQAAGAWTPERLILTGVVVAAGWGAVVSLLLALSPGTDLPAMLYWLMGDVGQSGTPWPALFMTLIVLALALPLGRSLNVLARGSLQAEVLGVPVRGLEWAVYLLASLATAVAVTTAGAIGFVGLVVPHMLRLVIGNDQRLLLPASALLGGSLLTLADTLARTVIAPEQLPVGVITAVIGVPAFLYLLYRSR